MAYQYQQGQAGRSEADIWALNPVTGLACLMRVIGQARPDLLRRRAGRVTIAVARVFAHSPNLPDRTINGGHQRSTASLENWGGAADFAAGRCLALDQRLRPTPARKPRPVGSACVVRHRAALTSPGSTRSRPSKNAATSSSVRMMNEPAELDAYLRAASAMSGSAASTEACESTR